MRYCVERTSLLITVCIRVAIRIYGNRALKTLPGALTRPTPGRIREAVFNIWQGQIAGCRWLDLCAGSGQMGAEALCRGAAQVVGIEQSGNACQVIRENWEQVGGKPQRWQVIRGDVRSRLSNLSGPFDRIYFDPPYAGNLYESVLTTIASLDLLAPEGELIAEYDPKLWNPETCTALALLETRRYGNSAITFFGRVNADA
ncbi:MAG: 16S rRNA (guanine(966)-N(2))-methyltransferase RsmD [Cyanobacteria bacterium P01_H01_bin.15]